MNPAENFRVLVRQKRVSFEEGELIPETLHLTEGA